MHSNGLELMFLKNYMAPKVMKYDNVGGEVIQKQMEQ